ncbi:TSUP family transporter, partial [bacterium]|nr:TSUP family transporter [bacterium]
MTFVLVSLFLGIIVGVVSSLFGIGGGIFIVPLLPNLLGVTPHQAVATSLASVFLVTLLNTVSFSREKLVNWKTGLT